MSGDIFPAACYGCGRTGHYAADCPERKTKNAGDRHHDRVMPPPVPPPRAAHQIADAHAWAERIREQMGWKRGVSVPEEPEF